MSLLRKVASGLRFLFRREQVDRELDEELRAYQQMATEEKIKQGMSPNDAVRAVRLERGNLEVTKEVVRSGGWESFVETCWQDLRFAARTLRKSPGFTLVAVLTLALAIGANTSIFSVVNAVLFKSLPFDHPEQIVLLWNNGPAAAGGDRTPLAVSDLLDWRAHSNSFTQVGALQTTSFNYVGGNSPEWIQAANVTANFFSLLGVQPALGRNFVPDDGNPGAPPVAILGDGFWRSRFASDPGVIGRSIRLDGDVYTIIGVAPPRLDFPSKDAALWTALQLKTPTRRGPYFLTGIARLKRGMSLQAAHAEVNTIKTSFPSGEHMMDGQRFDFHVLPISEFILGDVQLALVVLWVAVTLVLFIAAVNVANLMLVRSAMRIKEMSLRAALGAGRWRIFRQLLTESVLLALTGGIFGAVLAAAGVRILLKLAPDTIPRLDQIRIDWQVLAWTAVVSLLTGVFFGLAPAWQSARLSLDEALKEAGRANTESARKGRWRGVLVVTELALA